MTTAYTPILKLALPVTGELNGAWGDVVNNNITSMVEQAVAGLATINTWTTASHTLTSADGTTDEARCAILQCSGAPGAAATVICPAASKVYIIKNSVTGGFAVTLKTSAGTGISVANGATALLYCDGTNVVSGGGLGGDVVGPASATDNAVARYDGTTGKIIQNSAVTIADTTGDMAGVGTLTLNSTLGVKTAASAEYNILVGGNLTGGANSGGLRFQSQIQSDVTSNARGIISIPSTAAAAFTIGNLEHFFAGQGSLGAGSAISNQYGYRAASSLTGATNNYGFFGDIASGTGRWNFYAAGTAANVFAGTTSIGGLVGAESLRVTPVASAVNYVEAFGAATANRPLFRASGSDTNIGIEYQTKAAGVHLFRTDFDKTQFQVAHTASAVNYLSATGGATGAATTLSAQGSDTNVDIALTPKGDGYVVVDSAYSPNLTLTDAATIAWNTGTAGGQVATFTFVSTNRTVGAPTNLKNGGFYALAVIQNAGSNTLTWNAVFKWAGGTAPTLSTAAGAKDYFVFRSDGTNLYQQGISQAVA